MGFIREPDGVEFVVQSQPLTPKDIAEIQEWIRRQREADKTAKPVSATVRSRKKHKTTGRARKILRNRSRQVESK